MLWRWYEKLWDAPCVCECSNHFVLGFPSNPITWTVCYSFDFVFPYILIPLLFFLSVDYQKQDLSYFFSFWGCGSRVLCYLVSVIGVLCWVPAVLALYQKVSKSLTGFAFFSFFALYYWRALHGGVWKLIIFTQDYPRVISITCSLL